MAASSSLVIKRVSSSSSTLSFFKLFNPVFIPSASRSFITRTLYFNNDDGSIERYSCRCSVSRFPGCSGCNCRLNPQVGKYVQENFMVSRRGEVGSERAKRGSGWDVREDKEAVYLKLELPGMAKDDVKITLENNSIVIKGETAKDGDDETNYRFSGGMSFPTNCDIDSITAEMKNGLLKVIVPKAKDNVRHITIE